MKLMSTYGATIKIDNGTTQRSITENGAKVAKTFKYTEPGVGKYLPWPSILVFLVCGQLTGIQEPSKTVIWYRPPTRVRFLRTRVRLRQYFCTQIAFPVHTVILLSVVLYWHMRQQSVVRVQYETDIELCPCTWGTGALRLEVYQYSIPSTQYSAHTAGILMQLNFEITTTKIWYLVSVTLWYAV